MRDTVIAIVLAFVAQHAAPWAFAASALAFDREHLDLALQARVAVYCIGVVGTWDGRATAWTHALPSHRLGHA